MIPVGAAISLGSAALGALTGRHGTHPLSEADIARAYAAGSQPFKFTADPNDPALVLQNLRAGNLHRINRGNAVNELYRGGLGGSSIALNSLQGNDAEYARQLEDIGNQNLESQRQTQLGLFNSNQDYMRQLQIARLNAISGANSANAAARTGAIGALGQEGGQFLYDYLNRQRTPSSPGSYNFPPGSGLEYLNG